MLSCDITHCLPFGIVESLLQYFSSNENLLYNFNLIEVTILEENGTKLAGWEKAYYPAQQIRENGWEGIVLRKVERSTSCQLCEVKRQIRYRRTTCTDTVLDVLALKWYSGVLICVWYSDVQIIYH
jgi:hypothetical protein